MLALILHRIKTEAKTLGQYAFFMCAGAVMAGVAAGMLAWSLLRLAAAPVTAPAVMIWRRVQDQRQAVRLTKAIRYHPQIRQGEFLAMLVARMRVFPRARVYRALWRAWRVRGLAAGWREQRERRELESTITTLRNHLRPRPHLNS